MNNSDFLRDTIDLVKQIETRFIELGRRLFTIKEKELWTGQYDTYQEFLDDARINPGHDSILRSIHKNYVVEGNVKPQHLARIGYSNLYEAIPLIEKDGVELAVEKARTLTRSEIKDEVREDKHGECKHEETITICSKCHKRLC